MWQAHHTSRPDAGDAPLIGRGAGRCSGALVLVFVHEVRERLDELLRIVERALGRLATLVVLERVRNCVPPSTLVEPGEAADAAALAVLVASAPSARRVR